MKMQKKQFRIGVLAKELAVEKFVIRFWEKEFHIKSGRSVGGQRYYTAQDVELFKKIKELLYEKKFTIAGAKEALQDKNAKVVASTRTTLHSTKSAQITKEELLHIRDTLYKLQKLL